MSGGFRIYVSLGFVTTTQTAQMGQMNRNANMSHVVLTSSSVEVLSASPDIFSAQEAPNVWMVVMRRTAVRHFSVQDE